MQIFTGLRTVVMRLRVLSGRWDSENEVLESNFLTP